MIKLFGIDKDILYVCSYVPPQGSPFYAHFDLENGICLLEDCLTDYVLTQDVYVMLNGDLNSRTSNVSQDCSTKIVIDMQHKSQSVSTNRCSEDLILNTYGKLLLNMCTALDLSILNGVCKGDLEGRYTYMSESGCSVNDYFIFSNDLASV